MDSSSKHVKLGNVGDMTKGPTERGDGGSSSANTTGIAHIGQAANGLRLAKGVHVQLVNLTQESLNGCSGEIVDYVEKCKRCTIQVRVNNNETTLNIKAENQIVVKTETTKTQSTCRDFDMAQRTLGHGRGEGAVHGKHEKEAVYNADQPILFDGSACPTNFV